LDALTKLTHESRIAANIIASPFRRTATAEGAPVGIYVTTVSSAGDTSQYSATFFGIRIHAHGLGAAADISARLVVLTA
jgi:hypothetical protein